MSPISLPDNLSVTVTRYTQAHSLILYHLTSGLVTPIIQSLQALLQSLCLFTNYVQIMQTDIEVSAPKHCVNSTTALSLSWSPKSNWRLSTAHQRYYLMTNWIIIWISASHLWFVSNALYRQILFGHTHFPSCVAVSLPKYMSERSLMNGYSLETCMWLLCVEQTWKIAVCVLWSPWQHCSPAVSRGDHRGAELLRSADEVCFSVCVGELVNVYLTKC